jgi:hypothetical protein
MGGLEVRKPSPGRAGTVLRGRFPYNKPAVLSDGGRTGRPRKEVIAPGAFSYRLDLDPSDKQNDIHLLAGHSYDRPLASRTAGTLEFSDTPEALIFDAIITPEMERVSYVQDVLGAVSAGLVLGISPGFRLPPERAVPNPEKIEDEGHDPENGAHNAIIRTVLAALLYEVSLVTRPAYPEAQVEERNWHLAAEPNDAGLHRALNRWRA